MAGCATNKDLPVCAAIRPPEAEIYAIDVSFAMLPDAKEREYLNQQPTSFVLPPEAVDRLRAAAGTIIFASPEFQRLLKDVGATSRCRSIRRWERDDPGPLTNCGRERGAPRQSRPRQSGVALSLNAFHPTQPSETR